VEEGEVRRKAREKKFPAADALGRHLRLMHCSVLHKGLVWIDLEYYKLASASRAEDFIPIKIDSVCGVNEILSNIC
jgi:hypothetical protein